MRDRLVFFAGLVALDSAHGACDNDDDEDAEAYRPLLVNAVSKQAHVPWHSSTTSFAGRQWPVS